jgi:hypothetical protein
MYNMNSRLNMFNIGSLAVGPLEQFDYEGKDVQYEGEEGLHGELDCRTNS